ncbi:MAG TPA: DUF58 domain-containing protein [Armatimonadota bacterium]|nr:DUF58 domain-containing protein [Armatimonadota bacterium]
MTRSSTGLWRRSRSREPDSGRGTSGPGTPQLSDILDRVRRLELKTQRLVDSLFAGQYRSAFRGHGLEFRDVREYDYADDVRLIDWRVTARTGVAHVRQYDEERELTIVCCVDISPSSAFGTTRGLKRDVAAELAAYIGFSAARSNDRFGCLLFSDRVEELVPPRKGRRHVLRIVRDALAFEPTGRGTSISAALRAVHQAVHKRCVLIVVSDFMDRDFEHDLRVASLRHDAVAVELVDPREYELPSVGLVELVDPETGATQIVDSSDGAVRSAFAASAVEARQRRLDLLRSAGVDVLSLRTDQEMFGPLMRFFRSRRRWTRR